MDILMGGFMYGWGEEWFGCWIGEWANILVGGWMDG